MDNIERINTVRYQLSSKPLGILTIQEPKGWENDSRAMERDKDSRAILTKTEVALEFFGNAASYITRIFREHGAGEKITLTKHEKDPYSISEDWKLRYVQELDLLEYQEDPRTGMVKVKAHEGGLFEDIKSRISDTYNLINTESADGQDIGRPKTYPFMPQVREIYAESLLSGKSNDYPVATSRYEQSNSFVVRTIPLAIEYSSDKENVYAPNHAQESQNAVPNHTETSEAPGDQDSEMDQFYKQPIIEKKLFVSMKVVFKINSFYRSETSMERFGVAFRTAEKQANGDVVLKSHETLLEVNPVGNTNTYTVTFDRELNVLEGESLSFVFFSTYFNVSENFESSKTTAYLDVSESWVRIEDRTQYSTTVSRCMKPIDLFDRLVAKITGTKGLVRSSLFETGGMYEHFVVDNGFWARGFPDMVPVSDSGEEEEEEIQFNTSFKDAFDSFCYLEPLCWYVETEGDKQVVRIESAKHTQQNFVGVRLPSVDQVNYKSSKSDWFSTIELGHEGDLNYEEINGLDETNGKSEFSTHLKRAGSKYSVLSKYRTDSVGYELIRRKNYQHYPKEDTDRDEDIWMHDAKIVVGTYVHRLWNDRDHNGQQLFYLPPQGIYSPGTAWNLRLSPMNRLVNGHGYSVARCLHHDLSNEIRFNSSNANQKLKAFYSGRRRRENGSVTVGELERARVEAEEIEVSFRMTHELEDRFFGSTLIDGKQVPNVFGLIEFVDKGRVQYGRITKLSGGKDAKLTMIKAKT